MNNEAPHENSADAPRSDASVSDTGVLDTGVLVDPQPWKELARLARVGTSDELSSFIFDLSTADQALSLSRLDEHEIESVLAGLDPDDAAELISRLSETQAAQAISTLEAAAAAAIVHELPSDEQADVLGDLQHQQAEAILESLPKHEAAAVRELTAYDDDVAGGLMVSELMRFGNQMTVADVIAQLMREQDRYRDYDVRYGYVCDDHDHLVGVLPMQNLLFVQRSQRLVDVMIDSPLSVLDSMPLDDLIEFFETHHFLGVPVIDGNGVLKGVVHRGAVDHAASRSSESDYLKSQGIVGGEELRTMPLWLRARRRLSWLSTLR